MNETAIIKRRVQFIYIMYDHLLFVISSCSELFISLLILFILAAVASCLCYLT